VGEGVVGLEGQEEWREWLLGVIFIFFNLPNK
jgi:hypothetical protein